MTVYCVQLLRATNIARNNSVQTYVLHATNWGANPHFSHPGCDQAQNSLIFAVKSVFYGNSVRIQKETVCFPADLPESRHDAKVPGQRWRRRNALNDLAGV
jgi:hypothetical protein